MEVMPVSLIASYQVVHESDLSCLMKVMSARLLHCKYCLYGLSSFYFIQWIIIHYPYFHVPYLVSLFKWVSFGHVLIIL